jgi:hypothetical protein
MARYIATDFTGVFTNVSKTTMLAQFEHLHSAKPGNPNYGHSALEDYCKVTSQYGMTAKSKSSDHALIEWFVTMGDKYGMTKKDMEDTIDNCFADRTLNNAVIDSLVTLAREHDKKIIIVSKNPYDEVAYVAKKINDAAGYEVIAGAIGSELIYDAYGRITGVSKLISDKAKGSIDGIVLAQKSDEISRFALDYDFISDEKDFDIARKATEMGNKAVLIRHLPDGEVRDPYFASSEDYQKSSLESGAYNTIILNDENIAENLVKELAEDSESENTGTDVAYATEA